MGYSTQFEGVLKFKSPPSAAELRQRAFEFVSVYLALGIADHRLQSARRSYIAWRDGVAM